MHYIDSNQASEAEEKRWEAEYLEKVRKNELLRKELDFKELIFKAVMEIVKPLDVNSKDDLFTLVVLLKDYRSDFDARELLRGNEHNIEFHHQLRVYRKRIEAVHRQVFLKAATYTDDSELKEMLLNRKLHKLY